MNGISKSPIPGALPRSTGPPLPGSAAHEEKGLGRPLPPDVHERGAALPQQGAPWVGATEKFGSIPKKKREMKEQE